MRNDVVECTGALTAVSQMVDAGNFVGFCKQGSFSLNLDTLDFDLIDRVDDCFEMELDIGTSNRFFASGSRTRTRCRWSLVSRDPRGTARRRCAGKASLKRSSGRPQWVLEYGVSKNLCMNGLFRKRNILLIEVDR